MGDGGGHGAGLEAVALDEADADVMGVPVALHHGNLQHVVFHVDAVGVAGVLGGDLPVHHADDAPGPVVHEILRREASQVEGAVGPLSEAGVDLRGGEVPHRAVLHHQNTLLEDLFNVEIPEIVNDYEVRQISRGDSPPVVQKKVPGGVVAGHLHGGDGIRPQGDGHFHDIVDVALFQQVARVLVVRAEHAPLGVLIAQQGGQRLQVSGGGTLPDHDELAPLQLGNGVLKVVALVVGVHPGGDVCVEVAAP